MDGMHGYLYLDRESNDEQRIIHEIDSQGYL